MLTWSHLENHQVSWGTSLYAVGWCCLDQPWNPSENFQTIVLNMNLTMWCTLSWWRSLAAAKFFVWELLNISPKNFHSKKSNNDPKAHNAGSDGEARRMVDSETHLCELSNIFLKVIKIADKESEERDPSKKFLTQKHILQPQLVEEGQAGSLENPSGDRSRFQTVASPAASQTPGQRQDKKTGRGQKYEKDRKTKKLITRIAIIKFFHTTPYHHKSIQISEEREYCA